MECFFLPGLGGEASLKTQGRVHPGRLRQHEPGQSAGHTAITLRRIQDAVAGAARVGAWDMNLDLVRPMGRFGGLNGRPETSLVGSM